jgi:hypothetical protein
MLETLLLMYNEGNTVYNFNSGPLKIMRIIKSFLANYLQVTKGSIVSMIMIMKYIVEN